MPDSSSRVAIVGGVRTPFTKAGAELSNFSALDLGAHVVQAAVQRLKLEPASIDELIFSTVLHNPRIPNLAREILFRTKLPRSVVGHTVSNNCISGLVALANAAEAIASGRIKTALAGGVESMSRPSLSLPTKGEDFFLRLARARSFGQRAMILSGFKPRFVVPVPPSPKEPSTGLTMGQHCELMAKEFKISRAVQDEIALKSHHNAAKAQADGYLAEEIEPLGGFARDLIVRADTSLEKLQKLKPVFDRSPEGTITAGTSSALTDGASVVALMAESEARAKGIEILGYLRDIQFSAIEPADGLLMAPATAVPALLARTKLSFADIDVFEIHEAFAAQVAANMQAWEHGWAKYKTPALGSIPTDRININGGSIAIGHPFAATGGRLVLSTLNQLKRSGKKRGLISVCAAGAMGCAVVLERS